MNTSTLDSVAIPTVRSWSAYQRAIFENVATGTGHTVVVARAGSGKTATIMESLHHVPDGCSVFLAAFSKTTADELRLRAPRHANVGTLHSYGFKAIGRAVDRGVKIRVDPHRTLGICERKFGALPERRSEDTYRADLYQAIGKLVALAKGALVESAEGLDRLADDFGIEIPTRCADGDEAGQATERAVFLAQVRTVLAESRDLSTAVIDFDDIVWLPVALGLRVWQYDRVFIDETQDLNRAQLRLAIMACRRGGRILAVGDPKQAIYAFRGADEHAVDNIIDELHATVLPLSVCYRCDSSIIAEAQALVPDIEAAPGAAAGTVATIDEAAMKRDVKPGDFILSRSNAPLVGLCLGFLREGRAATIQGRDIGEGLIAFVRASKKVQIGALIRHIETWQARQIARLEKKIPPQDTSKITDKAETLLALCDGMQSAAEVIARIQALFANAATEHRIALSTTHRAKGLERDTAYLLLDTYGRKDSTEEANLKYVAITRARHHLRYVTKAPVAS